MFPSTPIHVQAYNPFPLKFSAKKVAKKPTSKLRGRKKKRDMAGLEQALREAAASGQKVSKGALAEQFGVFPKAVTRRADALGLTVQFKNSSEAKISPGADLAGLEVELRRVARTGEKVSKTVLGDQFGVNATTVGNKARALKLDVKFMTTSEAKARVEADMLGMQQALREAARTGQIISQSALAKKYGVSPSAVRDHGELLKKEEPPVMVRFMKLGEAKIKPGTDLPGLDAALRDAATTGCKVSRSALARQFGASSPATVVSRARTLGLTVQFMTQGEANAKAGANLSGLTAALREAEKKGRRVSSSALAQQFGVSPTTVTNKAKELGLTVQFMTHGEARAKACATIKLSPVFQFSTGQLSREQLTAFNWQVSIDGKGYTLEALEAEFANRKSRFRKADLCRAIKVLERPQDPLSTLEAAQLLEGVMPARLKAALPKGVSLQGKVSEAADATQAVPKSIAELRSIVRKAAPYKRLATPKGFSTAHPLKAFQIEGLSWMNYMTQHGLGVCLADDMGLGKTAQALALIQYKKNSQAGKSKPTLVVVPASLLDNWKTAAQKFTPTLRLETYHGKSKRPVSQKADIVVTTYETLAQDDANGRHLTGKHWSGLILDEGQKVKNLATNLNTVANAMCNQADYRVVLTGTPMENHVGELYSVMDFLNPGILGNTDDFKRLYFNPIHARGGLKDGKFSEAKSTQEARAGLMQLVEPFILRRTKQQVDIRKQIHATPYTVRYQTHRVPLSPVQTAQYQAVVDELKEAVQLPIEERRGVLLGGLTRLRQIVDDPRASDVTSESRFPKIIKLQEILKKAVKDKGEKALVFTQFSTQGARLQSDLEKNYPGQVLFFHGKLSQIDKQKTLLAFRLPELRAKQAARRPLTEIERTVLAQYKNKPDPKIMVLTTKAGNAGLNLQPANHVIHYDRWWNPAVENQATARVDRMGQSKDVYVHYLQTKGTIEDAIQKIIDEKSETIGHVIPAGKDLTSKLSTRTLQELLVFAV